MSRRHVREWPNGYPEADTPPITDAERAALERRRALEPEDAGRRRIPSHYGAAPDTTRSVGLD